MLRQAFLYVLAAVVGSLLAALASPSLLLPIFLVALAVVALLAALAHRFPAPSRWSRGQEIVATLAALAFGRGSMRVRSEHLAQYLVLAICFLLGLALTLVALTLVALQRAA